MNQRAAWGRFAVRAALLVAATALILWLPEPQTGSILKYKNAAACLVFVILLGKLLYDTFFYERWRY